MNLLCTVLISICSTSLSTQQFGDRFRAGVERLQIVGIFSNCANQTWKNARACKSSASWVNENRASFLEKIKLFKGVKKDVDPHWNVTDIEYVDYEICTLHDAAKIAVDIILGAEHHVKSQTNHRPYWNLDYIDSFENRYKILAMILYTNDIASRLLANCLTLTPFRVYHMDPEWKVPSQLQYHSNEVKKTNQFFVPKYRFGDVWHTAKVEFLYRKNVRTFGVFFLETHLFPYADFFKFVQKDLEQTVNVCYTINTVVVKHENTTRTALLNLKRDVNMKYLVLIGTTVDELLFFNEAIRYGIIDRVWIVQDLTIKSGLVPLPSTTTLVTLYGPKSKDIEFIESFPFYEGLYDRMKLDLNTTLLSVDIVATCVICSRRVAYLYIAYADIMEKEVSLAKPYFRNACYDNYRIVMDFDCFMGRYTLYIKSVFSKKVTYVISNMNNRTKAIPAYRLWSFRLKYFLNKLPNATCDKELCDAGKEPVFGLLQLPYRNYSKGWSCRECPKLFYKNNSGYGKCVLCPKLMLPSIGHETCYDPYRNSYNDIGQLPIIIYVSLASVAIILSLVLISSFVWHRSTPLVKAAEFKTTLVHLLLILTSFTLYLALFFIQPSVGICYARPFIVSVLQCSCYAVLLVKSHRILTIFNATLRFDEDDKKKMYTIQTFSCVLIIGVGIVLVIVTMVNDKPNIVATVYHQWLITDINCNTSAHINVQVSYILILQIIPAVQAFRCRNLPGPFNDAMLIIYTTFITVMCCSVMIPISHFLLMESSKSTLQCFVLTVVGLVQMVLLYGKRCYVIVFQKHKNNKNYVREKVQGQVLSSFAEKSSL